MRIKMSTDSGRPDRQHESGTALKERPKVKKPPLFKVLMHNDDYTTQEFVVLILRDVFRKGDTEAFQIMRHVHTKGVGVAGIYPHEVAEAKVDKSMNLARKFEFPLQLTLEAE